MKKITIYEPAMCCPTGLCGVSIDDDLLRMSTVLSKLNKKGIEIIRYNLTNSPMKFVTNSIVNQILNEKGVDELPLVLVDEEVRIAGRYPTNKEIAEILDISVDFFNEK